VTSLFDTRTTVQSSALFGPTVDTVGYSKVQKTANNYMTEHSEGCLSAAMVDNTTLCMIR